MGEGAPLSRSPRGAIRTTRTGARRWPASARTWRSITRGTTRRPRPATGACWARGRAIRSGSSRSSASPRAPATRRRRCGWRRRRSIAAPTRPSGRPWRCAPPSWPRRRRTIFRARPGWPGGRSRRSRGTRPRRTCWSGCTRRSGSGASSSRWSRCRRRRRPSASVSASAAPGAGRETPRETSTRFERVGALYEERLQDPGQGARPLRRVGRARRAAAVGAARVAAGGREGGRRAGRRRGGPEARHRDRRVLARRPLRLVLPRGGDLRGAGGGGR